MRAAQGAASSAQATDRSLPGRPESSFPPLGLLSPPNPLRWASAGAPITASANGAGGDADPVFASSVQPTAAMSPRFWGAPGAHPRPFLSHRFLLERKRCARRVGGAGGASDKNPAKPPSKKRRAPGASRQADGAPESSRPTSSAQAADRSLPRKRESSFPPLGLLSPPNPLRWASAGAPLGGRILSAPTGLAVGRPSAGLHSPSQGAVTSGRCRTGWSPARRSGYTPACPRRTRRAPPGSPGRRTRP